MFKNEHIGLIKEKVLKLFEYNLSGWVFTGLEFNTWLTWLNTRQFFPAKLPIAIEKVVGLLS